MAKNAAVDEIMAQGAPRPPVDAEPRSAANKAKAAAETAQRSRAEAVGGMPERSTRTGAKLMRTVPPRRRSTGEVPVRIAPRYRIAKFGSISSSSPQGEDMDLDYEGVDIPEDIEDVIYLDNAATVYPKPPTVLKAMVEIYSRFGVNPGRSGYDLCVVGGNFVQECRRRLCAFFGGTKPERLCFAYNASDALNLLIFGLVREGDHVISTVLEHNSVIRPLNHLKRDRGAEVDFLTPGADLRITPDDIKKAVKKNTRLVVVNHGSNVAGVIQPIAEIGRFCREKGILFIIDTAQTAGVVPIDAERMCVDALAFTGHKSLLGPTGIGGLYVRDGVEVAHTRAGGTGVKSAYPYHLDEYPYRLEVGTGNFIGIAGLLEAQNHLAREGFDNIYRHEMGLFERLQDGLSQIRGLSLRGTKSLRDRLPVLSFTVEGLDPSDVGTMLDVDHRIATRTGLQCAPLLHDLLGTAPRGTVRMSVGPSNVESDVDAAVKAMDEICAGVRAGA